MGFSLVLGDSVCLFVFGFFWLVVGFLYLFVCFSKRENISLPIQKTPAFYRKKGSYSKIKANF